MPIILRIINKCWLILKDKQKNLILKGVLLLANVLSISNRIWRGTDTDIKVAI